MSQIISVDEDMQYKSVISPVQVRHSTDEGIKGRRVISSENMSQIVSADEDMQCKSVISPVQVRNIST